MASIFKNITSTLQKTASTFQKNYFNLKKDSQYQENVFLFPGQRPPFSKKKFFHFSKKRLLFLENGFNFPENGFSDNDFYVQDNIFYFPERRCHFPEKFYSQKKAFHFKVNGF